MGGGHKVDVTTPCFLKGKHGLGKYFWRPLNTFYFVADIKVLAKDTKEVATGKKDGTGTVLSNKWPFLPKMGIVA